MNVDWSTAPPHYPPALRPPKRRSPLRIIFAIVMLMVALIVMAIVIGAIGASKASRITPAPSYTSAMPGPDLTPAAQAPATVVGPASVLAEGQWEVGKDVTAGKYRTSGPIESTVGMCYVERARNASGEVGSIIANDIVRGPKTITIKVGEFVTNTGCQTFEKIG